MCWRPWRRRSSGRRANEAAPPVAAAKSPPEATPQTVTPDPAVPFTPTPLDELVHTQRVGVTPELREKHDYRRDTAHNGRYLVRLPDRSLVCADEYEERLAEYGARQRGAQEP